MSDNIRPTLKEDFDNLPFEPYSGLDYPTHRFANFIPVADGADQFALRQSIEAIGQVEPIVLFEGAILDGRHRYKACTVVGVEPKFVDFEGDEEAALQFVLAKNIARRNLTTIQKLRLREQLTPEIERLRNKARAQQEGGAPLTTGGQTPVDTNAETAKLLGLGKETVRQYDRVSEAAQEDDFVAQMLDRVNRGELSVKKAYVDMSAELDKEAKSEAAKVDPNKQKAAFASAVTKAHALLIDWDHFTPASQDTVDLLVDLYGWLSVRLG